MRNIETLRERLNGAVILPGDPAYDEARSIWNGMIDRKPAVIVRCRTEADVVHAIEYARKNQSEVGMQPFTAWQQAFDPLLTHGARNYWKSHNFVELTDGLFDVLVDSAGKLPSPHCEIFVGQLGGQASRVRPDATAFGNRDANFVINLHGRWNSSAEDQAGIAWAREVYHATAPFATGGAYSNFMTAEETDRVKSAFGSNYPRLVQVKKAYDPENFFRLNQNILPK